MSDFDAIASFLSPPRGDEVQFLSSLFKGVFDCRAATNRYLDSGEKIPEADHDSWVGALGYLSLLDLIGTCLARKGFRTNPNTDTSPFVNALKAFTDLQSDQISALYALRCAFAHDFSLFNVHKDKKPELTHYFQLLVESDAPLVQPALKSWGGDYRQTPLECATAIGLTRVGDLVEEIYANLKVLAQKGEIEIRLSGGAEELSNRYSVMKTVRRTPI